MNHIHLNSTPSTQDYILQNFEKHEEGILVSTDLQTNGKGQYDRDWQDFNGSLALSFTLSPHEVITLTSLEVSVLLMNFLTKKFERKILLKWPNDLLSEDGRKFGGILINRHGNGDLVVGAGINLWPIQNEKDFSFTACGLLQTKIPFSSKELSLEIYNYILSHRKTSKEIISKWNQSCIHLNKQVSIREKSHSHNGVFVGIGSNGQAILENDQEKREIYTGSLFF